MAESGTPVAVEADLSLTIENDECAIWSEPDLLVVNVPTVSAARRLLSGLETLPFPVDDVASGLERRALTVELRIQHAPVAQVGADVEPSRLATLAGYEGSLSFRGLAVGLYRRFL
jgi:hypothetical protein